MESYKTAVSAEEMMRREADVTHTPLMGAFELLPLCNMDCRMCYVRMTREEMDAQGRMLACDEWIRIAEAACEKGMLYLLLTGGEPLLYPEFKRLYTTISGMGVLIEMNTNGTLIDEEWADFFSENGVRRLNITLYGKDNATYAALCGNPDGFTQVTRAAGLLKERGVKFRFNCSLTPDNIGQLSEFYTIAESFGVALAPSEYMFPGIRRGKTAREQYRLLAEEAAGFRLYGSGLLHAAEARKMLAESERPPRLKGLAGFPCHAGRSGFLINWKGEFLPCLDFKEPKINALEHSFDECWEFIVNACERLPQCQKCVECEWQNLCQVCPARCYAETGSTDGCPDYMCRMTEYTVRELREIIAREEASALT